MTHDWHGVGSAHVYITGTDTGIGKTHASVALLRALRSRGTSAAGMKPVASGCAQTADGLRNADALALQAASDPVPPYALCNPFALHEPASPHLVARRAGMVIDLPPIVDAYTRLTRQAQQLVVEGVGGWAAPLADDLQQADVARALGLEVIMVVGMRLGCINHALLTARAIRADGLPLRGWVANCMQPDMLWLAQNITTLEQHLGAPPLTILPFVTGAGQATLEGHSAPGGTMPKVQRFYLTIDDLSAARGNDPDLSFEGVAPEYFAEALRAALRTPTLWDKWRMKQDEPDEVDPQLGLYDPDATVSASQADLHTEVEIVTRLPHAILQHRLKLLVGRSWRLRDVRDVRPA